MPLQVHILHLPRLAFPARGATNGLSPLQSSCSCGLTRAS